VVSKPWTLAAALTWQVGLHTLAAAAQPPAIWLDRPPAGWNKTAQPVPAPPPYDEQPDQLIARCRLSPPRTTDGARALDAAGWIPFLNFGRRLERDDVEVVGGMAGADGMCRPRAYNLFVFVRGRFAGTLSPSVMTSRLDGASAAAAFAPPGITVEFARYRAADPLCCPSSRVMVGYRIDRSRAGPVIVPVTIGNK